MANRASHHTRGMTPAVLKTFRVRGLMQCMSTVDCLVNHRQWFTFRPLIDTAYPDDEYEFVLDAQTPESGYNFVPTRDVRTYQTEPGYGLILE